MVKSCAGMRGNMQEMGGFFFYDVQWSYGVLHCNISSGMPEIATLRGRLLEEIQRI